MSTVAIAKFKASLSAYLRKVQGGEEVVITDHGRPVVRMSPIRMKPGTPEHIQDLVRRGLARQGTGKLPKGFWDRPRPTVAKEDLLRVFEEEREDRT